MGFCASAITSPEGIRGNENLIYIETLQKRLRAVNDSLASYAIQDHEEVERIHTEELHPYRSAFQRDRDRIIHSKGFRRLGYKTQVFANSEGDNYRTRLTHSIEVSQISRSVAAALQLNQDLAETLALAHDLGHTPFGHAGQDALHEMMKQFGGFEHNCQSIRIVSLLESKYLDWNGLNLTKATLKGMLKHERIYAEDTHLLSILEERKREGPCLEAVLVDQCDRLAYIHHDLEDGVDSKILRLDDIMEIPSFKAKYTSLEKKESFQKARFPLRIRVAIRMLMDESIGDLVEESKKNLQKLNLKTRNDLSSLKGGEFPISVSLKTKETLAELQKFLFKELYRNPKVTHMSRRGARIISFLFNEYRENPQLLPRHIQERAKTFSLERTVADYVSGMTDRFAESAYSNLSGNV